MSRKTTTSFNISKSMNGIVSTSVFDRIVKEVDATEIPARYVEQIQVQYHDGNVVELSGNEITHPIPLNRGASWGDMEDAYRRMRDVKIFVKIGVLEKDINEKVEQILGDLC